MSVPCLRVINDGTVLEVLVVHLLRVVVVELQQGQDEEWYCHEAGDVAHHQKRDFAECLDIARFHRLHCLRDNDDHGINGKPKPNDAHSDKNSRLVLVVELCETRDRFQHVEIEVAMVKHLSVLGLDDGRLTCSFPSLLV